MLGKVILWVSAVVFIAYGLTSLLSPEIPAGFAGLAMTGGDAYAEIAAMYGGLQTGIGVFCLLAAQRNDLRAAGLMVLAIAIGALAAARLMGVLLTSEPVTVYSYGALIYEIVTAAIAAVALNRTQSTAREQD